MAQKKSDRSPDQLRPLVEPGHPQLRVRRQGERLGLSRSSLYYEPAAETAANLRLRRLLDHEYTAHPFRGSRRLTKWLVEQGEAVNRKRVQRLLRHVRIRRPDPVWSTDLTSVPLAWGLMYLAALLDWFSRYVIAWRLSHTLDGSFCLEMLDEALGRRRPEVFHTDPGVQFTAQAWTGRLERAGVAVSRDGRGRCLDNVFVERRGRTVKYADISLWGYATVPQLPHGLGRYFPYYNAARLHQALEYRTPAAIYQGGRRTSTSGMLSRPAPPPPRGRGGGAGKHAGEQTAEG